MNFGVILVLAVLAGIVVLYGIKLSRRRNAAVSAPPRIFRYKFHRYPFDRWQYFSVAADDQDAANVEAKTVFVDLFKRGATVMTVFYPA